MSGPPVEIHLKENAVPRACHTPAQIPYQWQEKVHKNLLDDETNEPLMRRALGDMHAKMEKSCFKGKITS